MCGGENKLDLESPFNGPLECVNAGISSYLFHIKYNLIKCHSSPPPLPTISICSITIHFMRFHIERR